MPKKAKLKICPFCGHKLQRKWCSDGVYYEHPDNRCVISGVMLQGSNDYKKWNIRCGEQIAELDYLKKFARESYLDEELCRDQLRCLWTAYCLRYNFDVDTGKYDGYLRELWEVVVETNSDTGDWHDFDTFDNFMCKYLV